MNIDVLVHEAVFGTTKPVSRYEIWQQAVNQGIVPASIHELYVARGNGALPSNFSVPAFNIRGITYDVARAAFAAAKKHRVGALIFELARSEMGYTDQPPAEYATTIMAAAIKESFTGALFLQCDHFQTKPASPGVPLEGEIEALKSLINRALAAGFYNVDIDTSTLVDLSQSTTSEQQRPNYTHSAMLATHVRSQQPKELQVSLGGEIGHIGGINSTVADFEAYMEGFLDLFGRDMPSLSKVSVQTGSSHGGVVLADGSLETVAIDFSILKDISRVARSKYGMGGAVQHGASTLPDDYFSQFAVSETLEVHFATGLQNLIYNHESFPKDMLQKIYAWVDENKQDERVHDMTDEQFHYKLRKKAWGTFKQATWEMDAAVRTSIRERLFDRFSFLFRALNVIDSADTVQAIVKQSVVDKQVADFDTLVTEDERVLQDMDD